MVAGNSLLRSAVVGRERGLGFGREGGSSSGRFFLFFLGLGGGEGLVSALGDSVRSS